MILQTCTCWINRILGVSHSTQPHLTFNCSPKL
jgi:hypothetical protein